MRGKHSRRFAGDRVHVPLKNDRLASSKYRDIHPFTGSVHRHPQQSVQLTPATSHRQQRLTLKQFHSRYENSNPENMRGRRTVNPVFPTQKHLHRPTAAGFKGNRGVPSLQWRSGLRESKPSSVRHRISVFSLFVDNIPKGLARSWLRSLFERCGIVIDVFVSAKIRTSNQFCFGFVRYGSLEETEQAISKLNGYVVRGTKLTVSMARYEKGGAPVTLDLQPPENQHRKSGKSCSQQTETVVCT